MKAFLTEILAPATLAELAAVTLFLLMVALYAALGSGA